MKLIVDVGNSRAKGVVMCGDEVVAESVVVEPTLAWLESLVVGRNVGHAIVSSTRGNGHSVAAMLRHYVSHVVLFEPATTPIPLGNHYGSKQTLGADRLAAAVGTAALYPASDIMIVDFGTAITIDYVVDGAFLGGNISPGVTTRFRALKEFTACLPLCSATDDVLEYGRTTREAIEQGVMRGVEHEIRGYVDAFCEENGKKIVIFTGGDAKYFVKRIKNAIFADCEPVVYGLSKILEYNA